MFTYNDLSISWLGHDGFMIEKVPLRIYIDPFKLSEKSVKPAGLVLITHEHFDHLSVEDLQQILNEKTIIVAPHECLSKLSKVEPGEVVPLSAGERKEVAGISVIGVAAYNTNKYRDLATKTPFHPKEDGKLGYLLDIGGTRIYHAGDTDNIPEMEDVACDIALLPVSGTYVMTAQEAAEAAKKLQPKVAIPMHYGSIVGGEGDASQFKRLLDGRDIRVEILDKAL